MSEDKATEKWEWDVVAGFIIDSKGERVCQLWNKFEDNFPISEVNGPQIVRDHNCHNDLVEMLRQYRAFYYKQKGRYSILIDKFLAEAEGAK